jgi:hypothetical protein
MVYFNGFSLHHEEVLFSNFFIHSDLCVSGFSAGAQKAFDYVYNSKERIDRLILLSPAFFQTQKPSFIRTQLRYFEAGQEAYVKQFLDNVTFPSSLNLSEYLKIGNREELNELLVYKWDKQKIQEILDKGTVIEVFLGMNDKIIDAKAAFDFFTPLTTTYFMKDMGHILKY